MKLHAVILALSAAATPALGQLVINEVDYDQVGVDTNEFVEIRNGLSCSVNLANLDLVFINGANNTEYRRVNLGPAGVLLPGQYLVVRNATVTIPTGTPNIMFAGAQDNIQNGAPDGVALVNTATLTVIDALSYEGPMNAAIITGLGPVNLVAGTPTAATDSNTITGSLARIPNGSDTGNDTFDWVFTTTITPGQSNTGFEPALVSCCGSADFNCDGDLGTDADIESFFACLSGTCPTLPCTSNADFNGDGDLGTDADIEAFFRVLGGGSC
jgi:hypothetical protein